MSSKVLKLAEIIAFIILTIIFIMNSLCLLLISTSMNDKEITILGHTPIIVGSNSFEPDIKEFSVCFMKETAKASEVKEGDIVFHNYFEGDKHYIAVDTVCKVDGNLLYISDSLEKYDSISYQDLKGVLSAKWNFIAPFMKQFTTNTGEIIAFSVMGIYLIIVICLIIRRIKLGRYNKVFIKAGLDKNKVVKTSEIEEE